ncbi:hypothetical protein A2U01_0073081, partial [Trifolium medium]|nr:hypothetical protein [Trifolium medium]
MPSDPFLSFLPDPFVVTSDHPLLPSSFLPSTGVRNNTVSVPLAISIQSSVATVPYTAIFCYVADLNFGRNEQLKFHKQKSCLLSFE